MLTGGCQCGAVRYEAAGEPFYHGLCHCNDCRKSAGAPAVGWIAFPTDNVRVTQGELREYASSEHGRRQFCPTCGTGILYFNAEVLPGIADIQSATLDNAGEVAPQVHVQTAERLPWMAHLGDMPEFERYPAMDDEG